MYDTTTLTSNKIMKKQPSLFEHSIKTPEIPLAHLQRPLSFDDFIGHEPVFLKHPNLKEARFQSLIITGPPGSGKTTLAKILAKRKEGDFYSFNAVLGGLPELKNLISEAIKYQQISGKKIIIFIDEIHRFNKTQQDALLPYLEEGIFILIGATTENPRISLNRALISRLQIITLSKLSENEVVLILQKALKNSKINLSEDILTTIAFYADGDARVALNALEGALSLEYPTKENVVAFIAEKARAYDKDGNRHYDTISAFIKSMRKNDPQSAILWLAVMLDGGEDPLFIARRLVIFASEDVGNADPLALTMAASAMNATAQIGMPESRLILAQATTYLASTYKSRSSSTAIDEALEFVKERATISLENVKQIPDFYRPTDEGKENGISKRLISLKL